MGRICLFTPQVGGGGAERVMVGLANGLCQRGKEVDLVVLKTRGALGSYLRDVDPGVHVINLSVRRIRYCLPGLIKYLRERRPEVLVSTIENTNIAALWAARLSGVSPRTVITVQCTLSIHHRALGWRGYLFNGLMRWFYPWADAVVACSQGVADDLSRLTGLSESRLHVIYNFVSVREIREKAGKPVDHRWFHDSGPPVILGVGRLTEQKNFAHLIHAFSQVRKQIDARLLILGEGEQRPALQALVGRLGLEPCVQLPGFVENPYSYMANASLFVLSSDWEGFPMVLLEALACGCPIVSTDCPSGPRELLADERFGKLVPIRDVGAMSEAILRQLLRPKNPNDLAKRAGDFSITRCLDEYLQVLFPEERPKSSSGGAR